MTKHKIAAIGAGLMLGASFALGGVTPALAETLDGIDIASYQAGIDASEVEGDFVIPKATQGTGYTNPYWREWAQETLAADKELGLYHYASGGNPIAEADHFVNEVGDYAGQGVFVLDWESYQNDVFDSGGDADWIAQFRDEVYTRTGQWCLVYVSRSAADLTGVDNEHMWIAQYASNDDVSGYQSDIWHMSLDLADGVAMRQYTSRGFISGWGGALDLDVFYGSTADWDTLTNGSNTDDPGEVQATYTYGIDVDGYIGYNTTTALQQQLHTGIVDGSISGHNSWRHKYAPSVTSWDKSYLYGSNTIKCAQDYLVSQGYSVGASGSDGYLGPDTVSAIQRFLYDRGYDVGVSGVDGILGHDTAVALQQSLNDDAWA
jgi:GH25 family lysozyme M1 (1,4-beta-N-acetylmuramidase)